MLSRTCGGGSTTNMLPRTWPLFSWFVHCMLCVRVREAGEGVRLGEDMSLASLAILSKQKSICQLLPLLFFHSISSLFSLPPSLLFPPLFSSLHSPPVALFLPFSAPPSFPLPPHTPTHPHTHTPTHTHQSIRWIPFFHQDEFTQALDTTDTGTHTTKHVSPHK